MKVIVAGGGFGGCAAAYMARKRGAEVTLLERTDMLLGTGLAGGIFRNNGRFTVTEEIICMGGGDLFLICDKNSRHKNIDFPGHEHASLYDISKVPGEITRYLHHMEIEIKTGERITGLDREGDRITNVHTEKGKKYQGDVFVDATGTAGPMKNCRRYGNGCAMCILRCPSFGGRVSLCGLAGINEFNGLREEEGVASMSGSFKLNKDSLGKDIVQDLETKGYYICPVPAELREDHLKKKACQQYAAKAYVEQIVVLDTGHAKVMTPFFPLDKLTKLPGFENARYEDPYAGGTGNSMRFFDMPKREDTMRVKGIDNLFVAGEKAGLFVGHTEAIVTGVLAGYNSVRLAEGKELFALPRETASGQGIAFARESMETEDGLKKRYTFSGSVLFNDMKRSGLYEKDAEHIKDRIGNLGLTNIFSAQGGKYKVLA